MPISSTSMTSVVVVFHFRNRLYPDDLRTFTEKVLTVSLVCPFFLVMLIVCCTMPGSFGDCSILDPSVQGFGLRCSPNSSSVSPSSLPGFGSDFSMIRVELKKITGSSNSICRMDMLNPRVEFPSILHPRSWLNPETFLHMVVKFAKGKSPRISLKLSTLLINLNFENACLLIAYEVVPFGAIVTNW